jgi:hypothetical protein
MNNIDVSQINQFNDDFNEENNPAFKLRQKLLLLKKLQQQKQQQQQQENHIHHQNQQNTELEKEKELFKQQLQKEKDEKQLKEKQLQEQREELEQEKRQKEEDKKRQYDEYQKRSNMYKSEFNKLTQPKEINDEEDAKKITDLLKDTEQDDIEHELIQQELLNKSTNETKEEIDEQLLINKTELEQFTSLVKDWMNCDDEIRIMTAAMKERRERKATLTPIVMNFMKDYKINDLTTRKGTIKFTSSQRKVNITPTLVKKQLLTYFNTKERGKECSEYIFNTSQSMIKKRIFEFFETEEAAEECINTVYSTQPSKTVNNLKRTFSKK